MILAGGVKRVLARNTAWNYAGFAVNIVSNLVMFPFVVHRLGDAASGVWLLLTAITGYMGLLELGIVPSLTQTIAASRARGERGRVDRVVSSSLVVLMALGTSSLLLLSGSSKLINWLHVPGVLQPAALVALRITVIGFALRMPLAAFQGILLGSQRQDRSNQLWIVVGAAKFAGAATVLSSGFGLATLVAMEMAVHLLAGVLQVRWAFQEIPDLRLSWRLANRVDAAHLLSFGGTILAVSVSSLIIEQTDRLVIAAFLPVAMVTYYAGAWKIYMLAYSLTTTIVQAVSPLAADLHGRNDRAGLTTLFLRTAKYSALIAWPLVFSLAFSSGFLLQIWMGQPFVKSTLVVQVLLIGFAVTAHNHAGYSALVGMRRIGPAVWRYFAPQAVLNLALSIWFVKLFGLVGVALGTVLPAIVLEYFFLDFVLHELRVGWREFLMRAVCPVAIPALVAFSPLAVAYARADHQSPLIPIGAAASTLVYLLLVWRWLEADERADVLRIMSRFSRHRRSVRPLKDAVATRPEESL